MRKNARMMMNCQAEMSQLFAVCLIASISEALLEDGAQGVRLVCGLSAALCIGRMAARLLG